MDVEKETFRNEFLEHMTRETFFGIDITSENVHVCIEIMTTHLEHLRAHYQSSSLKQFQFRIFDNVDTYRLFMTAFAENMSSVAMLRVSEPIDERTLPFWHCFCNAFVGDQIQYLMISDSGQSSHDILHSTDFVRILKQITKIVSGEICFSTLLGGSRNHLLAGGLLQGIEPVFHGMPEKARRPQIGLFSMDEVISAEQLLLASSPVVTSLGNGNSFPLNISVDLKVLAAILELQNLKSLQITIDACTELNKQQVKVLQQALKHTKIKWATFTLASENTRKRVRKTDFWDCLFASLADPSACSLKFLAFRNRQGESYDREWVDVVLGCFAKNLPNMTRLWGFQTPEFLGNGTYELLQAGVSKNKSLTYMALEGKEYTTFKPYMKRNKLIQEAVNIVASLSGRGCPGVAPLALVKLQKWLFRLLVVLVLLLRIMESPQCTRL